MKKYILCTIAILFACTKNNVVKDKTIIPVAETVSTGEILNLSDYAKSVEYIPLETNDSVLVGNIEQVIYEKNHIILYDFQNKMSMVFMDDGRFKVQLGRKGQGPGEYLSTRSMSFIPSSNEVFMDTYPHHYYIYDFDGKLKKSMSRVEVPQPFRAISTVALTPDLYFSHLVAIGDFCYRGLVWGKKDTVPVYKLFLNSFKYDRADELTGFNASTHKWRYKDAIRCYWEETDTIFTINSDLNLKKAFILDLGKYKESLESRFFGTRKTRNYKCISLVYNSVSESSRYLFLVFYFRDLAPELFTYKKRNIRTRRIETRQETYVYSLFDKETGKLTLLNQPVKHKYLGFKNDLDGGPCFWPKYVSSDDKMITWWLAEEFLDIYRELPDPSPELKKMAEKLTPDDNPVLMVVTLK